MKSNLPATFELCAETLDACIAAQIAGADRIELCADLLHDGTTPPWSLVSEAVRVTGMPVHVLVRPVADDFLYRRDTFEQMKTEIEAAKQAGAAGIVAGVLHADCTVAAEPMRELVALAAPLPLEFHRAFDRTPDLLRALEAVVETGCARVLTSGGAPTIMAGLPMLNALVAAAGNRVEIAAGGGLRAGNAAAFAGAWAGRHFHGSLGGANNGVPALVQRIRQVRASILDTEPLQLC